MSLGDINTETGPPGWWLNARLKILPRKQNCCCEIQRSENRMTNLAESPQAGYGSKMALLPMMMMMTMMMN
jgi:hypothetical protein